MPEKKLILNLLPVCCVGSASVLGNLAIASTTVAQNAITPDPTLGAEQSIVVPFDADIDLITGGAVREQNLFHSFVEFHIGEGGGVYFQIPEAGIKNVLSRITGNEPSTILGTLGSFNAAGITATPDFYLINPNGILFGPNASLDLPASFLATTAAAIELGNTGLFSATSPGDDILLSVDPSVLIFATAEPAAIINQAQQGLPASGFLINGPISFPSQVLPDGSRVFQPWGLQVVDGQTLGLVAGNVLLNGSTTAIGGRVEIGSPQLGPVNLTATPNGFLLDYAQTTQFGSLELFDSIVNTSGPGGGLIQLQAAHIFTSPQGFFSGLSADTQGVVDGQGILIRATESVRLDDAAVTAAIAPGASGNGGDITVEAPQVSILGGNSSLLTRTFGNGRAGDITVITDEFQTLTGAGVLTSTLGPGDGGNLTIIATGSVELSGTFMFAGEEMAGGLSADIRGTGVGGRITVRTPRLTLEEGADISARTNDGLAGSIFINAADIALLGGSIRAQTFGAGDAGDITVRTQRLAIFEGTEITTTAGFQSSGDAGAIDVIASESLTVDGAGGLSTAVLGAAGNGGDLTIQTGDLVLRNGGTVSAEAFTLGRGGNIQITADRIEVSGSRNNNSSSRSRILTSTASFSGQPAGDLTIATNQLQVANGGAISVDTRGSNAAGDLSILARESIQLTGAFIDETGALVPSRISASTSRGSDGVGGNIDIDAASVAITDDAELTVSSLGDGTAGNLDLDGGSLQLLNRGKIISNSASGDGGNLDLRLDDFLLLRNGSRISTNAGTTQTLGDGGNIDIEAPFVIAVREENSDITANAFLGDGGEVNISATGIFGLEFRPETTPLSDITASSSFGTTGSVNLDALSTDFIENSQVNLPENPVSTETLLAGSCITRAGDTQGSFVISGADNLPAHPGAEPASRYQTGSVRRAAEGATAAVESEQPQGDRLLEPTGIYELADGRLVLSHLCE